MISSKSIDAATTIQLNKNYEEMTKKGIKLDRDLFDSVAMSSLGLQDHRINNVEQIAQLHKELWKRSEAEVKALKIQLDEQRKMIEFWKTFKVKAA